MMKSHLYIIDGFFVSLYTSIKLISKIKYVKEVIGMGMINKLRTVNGGTIKEFVASDHWYLVELMGKGYSTHPTNIAATYFNDEGTKTEVCLWADSKGEALFCVYKFRDDDLQHYWSKNYYSDKLPDKYKQHAKDLLRAYSIEFNNGRMAFNYPRSWGLV